MYKSRDKINKMNILCKQMLILVIMHLTAVLSKLYFFPESLQTSVFSLFNMSVGTKDNFR